MADNKISVIIPTLNDPLISQVVTSVRAQVGGAGEIVVVGRDDQGRIPEGLGLQFLETEGVVSAPVARNLGIQAASGDKLVFIDSDCLPQPGWMTGLLGRLKSGESVVIGGVASPTDRYWVLAYNISMFHEFMTHTEPGLRRYAPTLNLAVRREVIERVGLMDEGLARGQDIEWSIRMALAGYRLFFEPLAAVSHHPARTDLATVWRYWIRSGHYMRRVRVRYSDYYRTPSILANPRLVRLLSPGVAAYITLKIFVRSPQLWRYLTTFPAVYITKIAWCLGAAQRAGEEDSGQLNDRTF